MESIRKATNALVNGNGSFKCVYAFWHFLINRASIIERNT